MKYTKENLINDIEFEIRYFEDCYDKAISAKNHFVAALHEHRIEGLKKALKLAKGLGK